MDDASEKKKPCEIFSSFALREIIFSVASK